MMNLLSKDILPLKTSQKFSSVLEPYAVKVASTVLRRGCHCEVMFLSDKEAAFYKLKEILEKYRCEIYNIVNKYGLDWSKTIVSPVNGLVYESLYNTQTVNDEMRNGMNKIFIINGYGQYFLQILMPDKCSEIKISN